MRKDIQFSAALALGLTCTASYAAINWADVDKEIKRTGWTQADALQGDGMKNPFVHSPGKYWTKADGKKADDNIILEDFLFKDLYIIDELSQEEKDMQTYLVADFILRMYALDVKGYKPGKPTGNSTKEKQEKLDKIAVVLMHSVNRLLNYDDPESISKTYKWLKVLFTKNATGKSEDVRKHLQNCLDFAETRLTMFNPKSFELHTTSTVNQFIEKMNTNFPLLEKVSNNSFLGNPNNYNFTAESSLREINKIINTWKENLVSILGQLKREDRDKVKENLFSISPMGLKSLLHYLEPLTDTQKILLINNFHADIIEDYSLSEFLESKDINDEEKTSILEDRNKNFKNISFEDLLKVLTIIPADVKDKVKALKEYLTFFKPLVDEKSSVSDIIDVAKHLLKDNSFFDKIKAFSLEDQKKLFKVCKEPSKISPNLIGLHTFNKDQQKNVEEIVLFMNQLGDLFKDIETEAAAENIFNRACSLMRYEHYKNYGDTTFTDLSIDEKILLLKAVKTFHLKEKPREGIYRDFLKIINLMCIYREKDSYDDKYTPMKDIINLIECYKDHINYDKWFTLLDVFNEHFSRRPISKLKVEDKIKIIGKLEKITKEDITKIKDSFHEEFKNKEDITAELVINTIDDLLKK